MGKRLESFMHKLQVSILNFQIYFLGWQARELRAAKALKESANYE